jgi:hypothetical protein
MTTAETASGSCLCGRITYALASTPLLTGICHCTHCQKQSGSAFSVNLVVKRSDLAISGEMASFADRGESGAEIYRRFCAACGSPILTESSNGSDIVFLKAGTLDDKRSIAPTIQIWCQSAQPWCSKTLELESFDRNLPS